METRFLKGNFFWRILIALCLVVSTMWVIAVPAAAATATIISVTPSTGPTTGGTVVTISGGGLAGGVGTCTFNGVTATNISNSTGAYVCTTPASATAGLATIVITTPKNGSVTNSTLFTYYNPIPTVTSVLPNYGPTEGGTVVTITGTFLTGATEVDFGTQKVSLPDFTVVNATTITTTTPPQFEGAVAVSVTTSYGTGTLTGGFTYTSDVAISAISPQYGPLSGGTAVTILGANFSDPITVTIGGVSATSISVVDSTHITCSTPAGSAGAQDVVVGGSATKTGGFTYMADPTVASILPATGSTNGGTTVTIIGTNFNNTATITIGGNAAPIVAVDNSTNIRATTAAHALGAVDVIVTTNSGSATLTNGFNFIPPPVISSVTPNYGWQTIATPITITGQYFTGVISSGVKVKGPCTNVVVVNDTTITCNTGINENVGGYKDVIITSPYGSTTLTSGFYMYPTAHITSISPNTGIETGGTPVILKGDNFTSSFYAYIDNITCTASTWVDNNTLTATTPAGTIGTKNVSVGIMPMLATLTGGFVYTPAFSISGISPSAGPTAGGTAVTITGFGFVSGATVKIGGNDATGVAFVDANHLTATAPAGTVGAQNVVVTNPDLSSTTLTGGFTYSNSIKVTGISPSTGPITGGTAVSITGANFVSGAMVTIGSSDAAGVFVDTNHMTATTPVGTAGAQNVVVTNPDTTSDTLAGGFTYIGAPTVSAISPVSGSTGGGTSVTITGTNFYDSPTVTIGDNATTGVVTVVSPTQIRATTPAGTPGPKLVVVTTPSGSSTPFDNFTYIAVTPTISSANPPNAPEYGGKLITITGTGFSNPASVTIGGNAATGVVVDNATQMRATTPAVAVGTGVPLIVTCAGVSSASFSYTITANPKVAGVSPNYGPVAGGDNVTITGTDFTNDTKLNVTFGGTASTKVTYQDNFTIYAVTPAHAAAIVNVVVTQKGTSSIENVTFTYTGPITITDISPSSGSTIGGDNVTISGDNFTGTTQVIFAGSSVSYTIQDNNTIYVTSPAHAAGAVDVSVTNPYGTVTSTGGFTYISPGADVDISITLQGGSRPDAGWVVPLTVKFFSPGTTTVVYTFDLTTAKSGNTAVATASGILPGTYDISAVTSHCLTNKKAGVEIALPSTAVNMGTLLEGNANNDININIADFGFLVSSYNKSFGQSGYNAMADFDNSLSVNIADFGLLVANYNKSAPINLP